LHGLNINIGYEMGIFGSKRLPKYQNIKCKSDDGIKFDSKKELARYNVLKGYERLGLIKGLVLQPSFVFEIKLMSGEVVNIKKRAKGSKALRYVADFSYYDKDGKLIVEDVKGFKTKDFLIKQALFETIYKMDLTLI
jgi:hypothetical protein